MSKKLEEELNLAPHEEEPSEEVTSESPEDNNIENMMTADEAKEQASEIFKELSNSEKVDMALANVTGLDEHDSEMDDIVDKALHLYNKLEQAGTNYTDAHAGRIYEVAANVLRTAMDARDSKVNRKLKIIEMQLKKARLDLDESSKNSSNNSEDEPGEKPMDRNEVVRLIQSKYDE